VNGLKEAFQERRSEIESYLAFLEGVERQIQSGPPSIGAEGPTITTLQQRMLYSGVYLQLYNLVEATITKCVDAICDGISIGEWRPHDLRTELQREWVKYFAETTADLNHESRLDRSVRLLEHLITSASIGHMKILRGGGGNWDDEAIYKFASRLGCALNFSADTQANIKRPFKNDRGALVLIVTLRNDLAHGNVSFAECGDDVLVGELKDLAGKTFAYLEEVVDSFSEYVETKAYLSLECRTAEEAS
jgi:hypothetical protein